MARDWTLYVRRTLLALRCVIVVWSRHPPERTPQRRHVSRPVAGYEVQVSALQREALFDEHFVLPDATEEDTDEELDFTDAPTDSGDSQPHDHEASEADR